MLPRLSLSKNDERELPLPVFHQLGLSSVCGSWGHQRAASSGPCPRFPCAPVPVAVGAPTVAGAGAARAERLPGSLGTVSGAWRGQGPLLGVAADGSRGSLGPSPCSLLPVALRAPTALRRWVCDKDPPANQR